MAADLVPQLVDLSPLAETLNADNGDQLLPMGQYEQRLLHWLACQTAAVGNLQGLQFLVQHRLEPQLSLRAVCGRAAEYGQLECVQYLLSLPVDKKDLTLAIILEAAANRHLAIVELLMDQPGSEGWHTETANTLCSFVDAVPLLETMGARGYHPSEVGLEVMVVNNNVLGLAKLLPGIGDIRLSLVESIIEATVANALQADFQDDLMVELLLMCLEKTSSMGEYLREYLASCEEAAQLESSPERRAARLGCIANLKRKFDF